MNRELMQILEQVAREKGLPLKVIVEAMVTAIELAARKRDKSRFDVEYDEGTGTIRLYAIKEIVESVTNPKLEIDLQHARRMTPNSMIGDEIYIERDISELGRISAQKAKQIINQKVKEAEKAIKDGADELDMVINIEALKRDKLDYVKNDISSVKKVAKDKIEGGAMFCKKICKPIQESGFGVVILPDTMDEIRMNVPYELGFLQGIGKPIMLLHGTGAKIKIADDFSDISWAEYIPYDFNDLEDLEKKLKNALKNLKPKITEEIAESFMPEETDLTSKEFKVLVSGELHILMRVASF